MMNRARHRYRAVDNQTSVTGRSPIELILLVYDRIADQLRAAEVAIAADRRADLGEAIRQATDLISQGLLSALDYDRGGEIAINLARLYDYSLRRLLHANLRRDVEAVREVAGLLADLREGWAVIERGQTGRALN
jgi:flagellar protein FliS